LNRLILVDENDVPLGTVEKMEDMKKPYCTVPLAFFIFNSKGENVIAAKSNSKFTAAVYGQMPCMQPSLYL